jgi:hypothetical protein
MCFASPAERWTAPYNGPRGAVCRKAHQRHSSSSGLSILDDPRAIRGLFERARSLPGTLAQEVGLKFRSLRRINEKEQAKMAPQPNFILVLTDDLG